jgi:hypothetical protein
MALVWGAWMWLPKIRRDVRKAVAGNMAMPMAGVGKDLFADSVPNSLNS